MLVQRPGFVQSRSADAQRVLSLATRGVGDGREKAWNSRNRSPWCNFRLGTEVDKIKQVERDLKSVSAGSPERGVQKKLFAVTHQGAVGMWERGTR